MIKYIVNVFLLALLSACGGANNSNEPAETKEAPAAIENSTQHPNGVTGGAVISRDTGAIAGDSSQVRPDSLPDKK
jgi:hypothetical protein